MSAKVLDNDSEISVLLRDWLEFGILFLSISIPGNGDIPITSISPRSS